MTGTRLCMVSPHHYVFFGEEINVRMYKSFSYQTYETISAGSVLFDEVNHSWQSVLLCVVGSGVI